MAFLGIRTFLGPEATADRRDFKIDKKEIRQETQLARIEAGSSVGDVVNTLAEQAGSVFAGAGGGLIPGLGGLGLPSVSGVGDGAASSTETPGFFDDPTNQALTAAAVVGVVILVAKKKK
jgi:hypothetical protein